MTSPQPSVVARTLNLSNAEARTEPVAHIYKITNTVSGKCYVGETTCKDPEERWRRHKAKIRRGLGCPALRDAINKYGVDKFTFEIIRECSLDERFDIECEYIKKYNTVVPNGYNILLGGGEGRPTGLKHKPESIEKIKTALKVFKEANPNHFETYRDKLAEAMKKIDIGAAVKKSEVFQKAKEEGRVGSAGWKTKKTEEEHEEIKQKISNSVKKHYEENESNKTSESKKINIEKHRIAMAKAVGKKIDQYSLVGKLIATYDSIREAVRAINKNNKFNIQQALDLETRTAYGFKWKTHQPKE